MDKEELKRALKKFLREKKITQVELSEKMQIQQSIISDMINGKRNPERLVDYLANNYGFVQDADVHLVQEQEKRPYTTNSNGIRFYEQEDGSLLMEVPKVNYSTLGSPISDYDSLSKISEETEMVLFPAEKVYHGKYYAFEVDGDSMDDGTRRSFERGDVVLVRELDKVDWKPKLHIGKWSHWVVCWGNCVRLKQITKQEGDEITLHSLNPSPEYTDFTLNLNDVSRLFNVIMKEPKTIKYENY